MPEPKRLLACLVLLLSFSVHAQTPTLLDYATRTSRIDRADNSFERALASAPDKPVRAALFFSNDVSVQQLKNSLSEQPQNEFIVRAIRHGTGQHAGGYIISEGESIDQALESYARDHVKFTRERIAIENRLALAESDPKARSAFAEHRREAEQLLQDFQARGMRVVGLEVEATPKVLDSFRATHQFVRVIEITNPMTPQPAILPR